MPRPDATSSAGGGNVRVMTAAQLRGSTGGGGTDDVEVVFLESARFYRVSRSNPRFAAIVATVRAALAAGRPLSVRLATPAGDVIEDVQAA